MSSIPSGVGDDAEKSQMFSYKDDSGVDHICSYTPTYSDVPSDLEVIDFTFPYAKGSDMPLVYLAQSRRDGVLYRYGDDGEPNQLAAANITMNKGENITTFPTKLIKGMKNVKLAFSFNTSYHFPKDSIIVLESQKIGLTLPSEVSCTLNDHQCTPHASSDRRIRLKLNAAEDFKPSNYELRLSGVDIDSSARDLTNITMQIYTSDNLLLANTSRSYVLRAAVATKDLSLSVEMVEYEYMLPSIRNSLMIDFKLDTEVYLSNMILEFTLQDMDAFQDSQPTYGYVTNINGQIITATKSVELDNSTVKVRFNSDLYTNKTLRLIIGNIISQPDTKTIEVEVKRGSNVLYSATTPGSTPSSDDLIKKSELNFTLQKEYSTVGFDTTLKLKIIASIAITRNSRIFVVFPSKHYSEGLSHLSTFTCKIDDTPTFCSLNRRYTLSVESISIDIDQNTEFTLTINSIQQLHADPESLEEIAVVILNNKFNPSEGSYGATTDTASQDAPSNILKITDAQVNNLEVLKHNSKFNFTIVTNMEIPKDDLVIFTFPDPYYSVITGASRGTPAGRIKNQDGWKKLN